MVRNGPRLACFLLAGLLLCQPLSCSHRTAVPGDDAGVDAYPYDGAVGLPDARYGDGVKPAACSQSAPLKLHTDAKKNFTLALHGEVKVTQLTNTYNPLDKAESAMALRWARVEALALTRAARHPGLPPAEEVTQIFQDFAVDLGKLATLTSQASGTTGSNHDGRTSATLKTWVPFADIKEATWAVTPHGAQGLQPDWLRNYLLASILRSDFVGLTGLPSPTAPRSTSLVVRLTVVKRPAVGATPEQIAVSAAVVDQLRFAEDVTAAKVEDLSNGTALVQAGRAVEQVCPIGTISHIPKADIIWVVDESDSMSDNRQDIVNNAEQFFKRAQAAGLDFRMAVTGMRGPDAKRGVIAGKLCSRAATGKHDDGGQDRFLLPWERSLFTACVKDPPYDFSVTADYGGKEYGLTNARAAVQRSLPRANNPGRVRPGAELAVLIVTDETSCELKSCGTATKNCAWACGGFLETKDFDTHYNKTCALTKDRQLLLDKAIGPYRAFFIGAGATVHLIGGTCRSGCRANLSWGYSGLVHATAGQTGDVCQKNLGSSLQFIINAIAADASPFKFKHTPLSSTLTVEVQTRRLQRSRHHGFRYNAASNSLTFNHVEYKLGHQVVTSYSRFQGSR